LTHLYNICYKLERVTTSAVTTSALNLAAKIGHSIDFKNEIKSILKREGWANEKLEDVK